MWIWGSDNACKERVIYESENISGAPAVRHSWSVHVCTRRVLHTSVAKPACDNMLIVISRA